MYIVSANYRDRQSPFKWLVRLKGQPAESAKAFKEVSAQGVTFIDSDELEQGFGCRRVAQCESVTCRYAANDFIRFDGLHFRDGKQDRILSDVASLQLLSDGSMYAPTTQNDEVRETTRTEETAEPTATPA